MTKEVAIFGAGGHARVIASILRAHHQSILGFFDDSHKGDVEIIQGAPLLGSFREIVDYKDQIESVFLALGDNFRRSEAFHLVQKHDFELPPLVHPKALIETDVVMGRASVVCLGVQLCTEVKIGKGCILNTGCSVDHESIIGDFTHLAPQSVIAGRSRIGDCTFIGMNACVADKITVGSKVMIGAGSVVLRDVPDNAKIVGVHA